VKPPKLWPVTAIDSASTSGPDGTVGEGTVDHGDHIERAVVGDDVARVGVAEHPLDGGVSRMVGGDDDVPVAGEGLGVVGVDEAETSRPVGVDDHRERPGVRRLVEAGSECSRRVVVIAGDEGVASRVSGGAIGEREPDVDGQLESSVIGERL
jgi:hypothetical protein